MPEPTPIRVLVDDDDQLDWVWRILAQQTESFPPIELHDRTGYLWQVVRTEAGLLSTRRAARTERPRLVVVDREGFAEWAQ